LALVELLASFTLLGLVLLLDRALMERADSQAHAERLQAGLYESQKLESLGRLVGGVAHDFNNLLSTVVGRADFLVHKLDDSVAVTGDRGGVMKGLSAIRRAGLSAATITDKLLTFSRRQPVGATLIELDPCLEEFEELCRCVLGDEILFRLDTGAPGARILVNRNRLEQAVLNLVLNARDAMPTGGELTVSTSRRRSRNPEGGLIDQVSVLVSDTGKGIAPEVFESIFEPFFTTKGPGAGTGLGLALVQRTVNGAGGKIEVESVLGSGSRFDVILPVATREATPSQGQNELRSAARERVLVCDDNVELRGLMSTMLATLGFDVTVSLSGAQALATIESSEPFDLLVTDVIMPGMRGPELASRASELLPDLKVLFVSGHSAEQLCAEDFSGRGRGFLRKPFTLAVLNETARALVAAGESPELSVISMPRMRAKS
jgi:signal transduction histidine kinase/ActR/RegA family two-component response regulator